MLERFVALFVVRNYEIINQNRMTLVVIIKRLLKTRVWLFVKIVAVHGYEQLQEYVDFYENKHRFRRKSIYHRKYHVINRIDFLSGKSKVQFSHKNKDRIIRIFKEIGKVLPQVNNGRKSMVSIDFLLKLFDLMGININVSLSKSPKTIARHNRYWKSIYDLIGEDIQLIISE